MSISTTTQSTESANLSSPELLPPEVRAAYEVSEDATVTQLTGGLVNVTVLVREGLQQTLFRKLSPALNVDTLIDSAVVSEHLVAKGLEAPTVLPTADGSPTVADMNGSMWHRMHFIASDGRTPPEITVGIAEQAGGLIGNWHTAVHDLQYVPRFPIPHFHDTAYQAFKTNTLVTHLPDDDTRSLARQLIATYALLPKDESEQKQIIHGDPKLDNMLFREQVPFALIDFDTLITDTVWSDVGDFLRSMTGKLLATARVQIAIESFVTSYHGACELQESTDRTFDRALRATQRIGLELGMRYLCDIVDGKNYFTWDSAKHMSRRDNHFERARLQSDVAAFALELTKT